MAGQAPARGVVEYAAAPRSHLWVALCLGLGGAALGASVALGLGEVLLASRRFVLEALFLVSS